MKLQNVLEHIRFLDDEHRMFVLIFLLASDDEKVTSKQITNAWFRYKDDFRKKKNLRFSTKALQDCIDYGVVARDAFGMYSLTNKVKSLFYILKKVKELEISEANGYNEQSTYKKYSIHAELDTIYVIKDRSGKILDKDISMDRIKKRLKIIQKKEIKDNFGDDIGKYVI